MLDVDKIGILGMLFGRVPGPGRGIDDPDSSLEVAPEPAADGVAHRREEEEEAHRISEEARGEEDRPRQEDEEPVEDFPVGELSPPYRLSVIGEGPGTL